MPDALKSYFTHHRAERNTTIAVAIFILLVIGGTYVFTALYTPPPLRPELLDYMAQLTDSAARAHREGQGAIDLQSMDEYAEASFYAFDPNTLSDSGYRAMGFSEKEIASLRKYLAKGGSFRYKEDFSKMYFMDADRYKDLQEYIRLPERESAPPAAYAERKHQKAVEPRLKWSDTAQHQGFFYRELSVELNSADTAELKQLRGIGSYFAKSIVKYRDKLGGYHSLSQLLEIKHMTTETIDKIAHQVFIDPSEISPVYINSATAQELSAHPYVTFKLANALVNVREKAGKFRSVEELKATGLMDEELTRKLVPYLSFE